MNDNPPTPSGEDWSCGGWEGADEAHLRANLKLSFRERLLWLQEADRLAAFLETQRPWIDSDGVYHPVRQPEAGPPP